MNDDTKRILQYLHDLMTKEERHAFEKELEQSPILKEKTQMAALENESVLKMASQDLKQKARSMGLLDEYDSPQSVEDKPQAKMVSMWKTLAIAAGLVILLSIGGISLFSEKKAPPSPLAVAENLLKPLEFGSLRSTAEEFSVEERALLSYSEGRYNEVLEALNGYPIDSLSSKLKLIKGFCHLEREDYPQAEKTLKKVSSSSVYYPPSKWYLALSMVFQNNTQEAMPLLNTISEDSLSIYQKQAQTLFNSIQAQKKN